MVKYREAQDKIIELLYDEFKTFRTENREDCQKLSDSLTHQNQILTDHSEKLIELIHTIHGNGTKGLIARINDIETNQKDFVKKFTEIETRERVRTAVLGAICALCSSLGGIIAYILSLYFALNK